VVVFWAIFGFRIWNSSPGQVKSCFWTLDWFYAGLAGTLCFSLLSFLSKADVQAEAMAKASAESLLRHGKGVALEASDESACLMSRHPQMTAQPESAMPATA